MINEAILDRAIRNIMMVGPEWLRLDLIIFAQVPKAAFLRTWIEMEIRPIIAREYSHLLRLPRGTFDRKAYQRELMRKRRAEGKA